MQAVRNAAVCVASLAVACALSTSPACAAQPAADVRGITDKTLRSMVQDAIGPAPGPLTSRLEARRRATEAGEKIVSVLRSEGYYEYVVVPDIGDGDTPQPFVTVTPGPRFKISAVKIDWIGAAPPSDLVAIAQDAINLKPGDPGRAEAVIAAEGRIVAVLQEHGDADAEAKPREVIVDHADHTVQPTYHIAAGALVRMGGVELKGKSRVRLNWVRWLAPWKPGQVYRPEDIAELERRLTDTGAFNTAVVALAPPTEAQNGQRPVIVSLTDRPKGTLELGGSYSTTEGAGVDSRWIIYNRLKRADTITTSLEVAQIESRLQTELALPDWRKPGQTLKLAVAAYDDDTDAYDSSGGVVSADLTHRFGKLSFITYGVSIDASKTIEKESANFISESRSRTLTTGALLAAFNLDKSNDPLDPTSGWRLSAKAEPTYALGEGSIGYLKASTEASIYLPIIDGTVIASRAKLGTILGGTIPLVPAPARFYAGGGGSVRGYGYQAVGPRYGDNTPSGGLSLLETSVELRQHVTQKWSVVAFLDAGTVGLRVNPDFSHPEVGVGVGARYNLGFGPIRVDIATPLQKREGDSAFQLYLSIGQSF